MALPEFQVEKIVDEIVGSVLGLRDFLQHHLALAIDLGRVEHGVQEKIRQQLGGHRQISAQHLGVVAGVLLAGERIEHTADGVDLLGDLRGSALARAFEEQMLDEVRNPVLGRGFVTRSVLDPDADGGRDHGRHRFADHAQAVGQYVFQYH